MKELIANGLWWLSCLPESAKFRYSTRRLEETQRRRLTDLLSKNCSSRFGRKYDFGSIRSVEEFQSRVPMMDETTLRAYADEIADGHKDVLFPGLPDCLQPTSGSTAGSKLIPYSRALRREYQAGIAPWVADMFWRYPQLLSGSAYWSISPAGHHSRQTRGGLRIGFEDDSEYLSPIFRRLLGRTLAVPAEVSQIEDMDSFRYVTLIFLLKAGNLSFVSIWNPTFLTLLVKPLEGWFLAITDDIRRGTLHPPTRLPDCLFEALSRRLGGPDAKRAGELDRIYRERAGNSKSLFRKIWPRLRVISCWADAAAQMPAEQLKDFFPEADILPKGLMATEGVVSIPKTGLSAGVLAIRSHFYEFLPEDGEGPVTAWNLRTGCRYSVMLTTGGGLYRYQLNDRVEVTGFLNQCPLLKFVGRAANVSDLYGEKLHEAHVVEVLEQLFKEESPRPSFTLLAPDAEEGRYALYIAGDARPSSEKIAQWRALMESELCKNFHYDYCRRIGQLSPVEIHWIEQGSTFASQRYLQFQKNRGQTLGAIKPVVFDKNPVSSRVFSLAGCEVGP